MKASDISKVSAMLEQQAAIVGCLNALTTEQPINITIGDYKMPVVKGMMTATLTATLVEMKSTVEESLRDLGVEI